MELERLSRKWITKSAEERYSYDFEWLGRPIIQYPQDIVVMQEIIWSVKPDLIIETGIAHGGSLIFYASLLKLIGHGEVLGVELNLYPENRSAIEGHPLSELITIVEASSVSLKAMAKAYALGYGKKVIVCLDSAHTDAHVLVELELYSPLVCKGSYIVVFDTIIEDLPDRLWKGKPYGKGNNPATAVKEFLRTNKRFEVEEHPGISTNPGGYLLCVSE